MLQIAPIVFEFIRNHARSSKNMIMGWLIGYITADKEPCILAAVDCQNYLDQNTTSAQPAPEELPNLLKKLSPGLILCGVYHSHPDNELSHKQIDPGLVDDSSTLPEYFIYIATNGTTIECYKVTDPASETVEKIPKMLMEAPQPSKITFKMVLDVEMTTDKVTFAPQPMAKYLTDLINASWKDRKYLVNKNTINLKKGVKLFDYSEKSDTDINEIEIQLFKPEKKKPTSLTLKIKDNISFTIFSGVSINILDLDTVIHEELIKRVTERILSGKLTSNDTWKVPPVDVFEYMGINLITIFSVDKHQAETKKFIESMIIRLRYISLPFLKVSKQYHILFTQFIDQLTLLAKKESLSEFQAPLSKLMKEFRNII